MLRLADVDPDVAKTLGQEALRQHRNLPSQAIVSSVIDEVRRFSPDEQHDDITLMVAKCTGSQELMAN